MAKFLNVTAWPAEGSVVAIQQDYCTKLKMQQQEGSQAWPALTQDALPS